MNEKKQPIRKLKKHVTIVLSNISMSLIGLRKAIQAAVGVVSDTVFNNNNPYLSYNPRVMTALQILLPIQMIIYAGYTLISTIATFIRLNDIWNNEGRYKRKPANTFKQIKTSIFSGAMALSDFSVFLLTILVVLNVTSLTSIAGISLLLINGAINIVKYGFKLIRLAEQAISKKVDKPKLKYSAISTAIKLSLAILMIGAMLSIIFVPSPINMIVPGVLLVAWAVGRLLHTNVFQPKLKAHFIDNQKIKTPAGKSTKDLSANHKQRRRPESANYIQLTLATTPQPQTENDVKTASQSTRAFAKSAQGANFNHPANMYNHTAIPVHNSAVQADKPGYNEPSLTGNLGNGVCPLTPGR